MYWSRKFNSLENVCCNHLGQKLWEKMHFNEKYIEFDFRMVTGLMICSWKIISKEVEGERRG